VFPFQKIGGWRDRETQGSIPVAPSRVPDSGADFVTMKSMSAGCAVWTGRAALSFLREFDARSNLDANKLAGFWKLET
jgi:hypothetical protein